MSAPRQLVLEPSNGVVTTLAFTETSLTVRSDSTTHAPKHYSFFFCSSTKPSHSEVPLHNVIAATVSGSTVEVSYLARTTKQHLYMNQVRGDVPENDVPLAAEWCASITQAAYQGSPVVG